MIHTAKQLKDKVRNLSNGDNDIARTLIRIFMMERFLERISMSKYKGNFVLKGGLLVSSLVGVDMRATMDVDTSVCALPLTEENTKQVIEEIAGIELNDAVKFQVVSMRTIMEDFDYPGIRMMLEASLDKLRQPIKIDISTDDQITPGAVDYSYKLMFEDRSINLFAYNIETLLAEKCQTLLSRGTANTRMRDFYDIYEILNCQWENVVKSLFHEAFSATCVKRKTPYESAEIFEVIEIIEDDTEMMNMWDRFCSTNYFVGEIEWETLMETIKSLF